MSEHASERQTTWPTELAWQNFAHRACSRVRRPQCIHWLLSRQILLPISNSWENNTTLFFIFGRGILPCVKVWTVLCMTLNCLYTEWRWYWAGCVGSSGWQRRQCKNWARMIELLHLCNTSVLHCDCATLSIMHCFLLANLDCLSRFPTPIVGANKLTCPQNGWATKWHHPNQFITFQISNMAAANRKLLYFKEFWILGQGCNAPVALI